MSSPALQPAVKTRKLRIIAQDPTITGPGNKLLTSTVDVPIENLDDGPRGYRVHVIDYDASTSTLYEPLRLPPSTDPFKDTPAAELLASPAFHAQNVYAIVMKTLAAFEFALGRRVSWAFDSHQIQIAPHAFAVANAFYSRRDQALLFGYTGPPKHRVFTCLSHDVVAHETTHAILDGLRERYMDPSSTDQFAFHEGFADVIALLSIFSLKDVVSALLPGAPAKDGGEGGTIARKDIQVEALKESAIFSLGEEIGRALRGARAGALRHSVRLAPAKDILDRKEFQESHRRGEVLVAAIMNSFIQVWHQRLLTLGDVAPGKVNRARVVEDGAKAAQHLMTMAIRALDYCPPTALTFGQYLTALLDADIDIQPDDLPYNYRQQVISQFAAYGIEPKPVHWRVSPALDRSLNYSCTHMESMQRDPDEVFRFLWENRTQLNANNSQAFIKVISVRPCIRQSSDGFLLRETVAEYHQILNLTQGEVAAAIGRNIPEKEQDDPFRLYGGGTLIFDEYGRLKYHAQNPLPDLVTGKEQLADLWDSGLLDRGASAFGALHLTRATRLPIGDKEETKW